jgi:hypothetical protein
MSRLSIWVAALWWASLSTLGFLVVPLLFAHLPSPAVAGAMAAKLFSAQTWVSTVCGLFLLMTTRSNHVPTGKSVDSIAIILIVCGLLMALLVEFAIAPRIVLRENLKIWHSVGSGMYLLQWLCAVVIFWKLNRREP